MELTTGTDIVCPNCNQEVQITTKGIFGGLLKQATIGKALSELKRKGSDVTCNRCQHKFRVEKNS